MQFQYSGYAAAAFLVALAAVPMSVSAASAQAMDRIERFNGRDIIREAPQIRSAMMHTVRLRSVPDSWLALIGPREWRISRSAPAASGAIPPEYALTVVRRIPYSGHCRNGRNDSVDLRPLKANGYRLVRYKVIPHREPLALPDKPEYRTRPPSNPADANSVGVQWTFGSNAALATCWSGYSLDIEVRGPRNIDPITGRKLSPSPVN